MCTASFIKKTKNGSKYSFVTDFYKHTHTYTKTIIHTYRYLRHMFNKYTLICNEITMKFKQRKLCIFVQFGMICCLYGI